MALFSFSSFSPLKASAIACHLQQLAAIGYRFLFLTADVTARHNIHAFSGFIFHHVKILFACQFRLLPGLFLLLRSRHGCVRSLPQPQGWKPANAAKPAQTTISPADEIDSCSYPAHHVRSHAHIPKHDQIISCTQVIVCRCLRPLPRSGKGVSACM